MNSNIILLMPLHKTHPDVNMPLQAAASERCADPQEESFSTAFGFLYEEYEAKYYYWESLIMLRKLLFVIVIVFLAGHGLDLQVMVTIGVVVIALALQVRFPSLCLTFTHLRCLTISPHLPTKSGISVVVVAAMASSLRPAV
jgi:hypothetical protein